MGNIRCTLCKQVYDNQFINRFETLSNQIEFIYVCENCMEEESNLNDDNMHYIRFNNKYYYASREVF